VIGGGEERGSSDSPIISSGKETGSIPSAGKTVREKARDLLTEPEWPTEWEFGKELPQSPWSHPG
jgi:hypothetical protein